jgi:RimJ/RimL family protein N-acetyltransferase
VGSDEDIMAIILTTDRLRLRHAECRDAPAMLLLLNEAGFLQNIGDKQVRDLAGAEQYLQNGPIASYQQHGFGLYLIERLSDDAVLGLCGLVQRDYLDRPDVGYALFEQFSGAGYTSEAALAVVQFAREQLGIRQLCGIVSPHNLASKRILEKAGMLQVGQKIVPGSDKLVDYYQLDLV